MHCSLGDRLRAVNMLLLFRNSNLRGCMAEHEPFDGGPLTGETQERAESEPLESVFRRSVERVPGRLRQRVVGVGSHRLFVVCNALSGASLPWSRECSA